jgi:drug/metabolite transporter (DMT)-like permease
MTLTLLPVVLMLMSGSVHAIVNAMIKSGGNRMAHMALISGFGTLFVAPFIFFVDLPTASWGWMVGAIVTHIVYFYCLVKALDAGDLSAAYPIFRGSAPLITTGIAIAAMGETVTFVTIAGIVLISAGMWAMAAGKHINRPTILWSLATGVLIAAYTTIDAVGIRAAPSPQSFIIWLFFIMGIVSMITLPFFAGNSFVADTKVQWRSAALAGALSVLTFGSALFAFSLGPTAQLAALRETGMVTALLISIFVLKEPVTWARVIAILTICAGAVLIISG